MEKIERSDNIDLLDALNEILSNGDKLYQIPEKYLPGIKQGMKGVENNDVITLDQFESKFKEWLK